MQAIPEWVTGENASGFIHLATVQFARNQITAIPPQINRLTGTSTSGFSLGCDVMALSAFARTQSPGRELERAGGRARGVGGPEAQGAPPGNESPQGPPPRQAHHGLTHQIQSGPLLSAWVLGLSFFEAHCWTTFAKAAPSRLLAARKVEVPCRRDGIARESRASRQREEGEGREGCGWAGRERRGWRGQGQDHHIPCL